MHPRLLLNLALVVAVALLAGLVIWKPGQTPDPAPTPLTGVQRDQLTRIGVEHLGQQLTLLRRNGRWELEGEPTLIADSLAVEALIALAGAEVRRRYPAEGIDLQPLGLAEPETRLSYDGLRLALGDSEALSGDRYVLLGDELALIQAAPPQLGPDLRAALASRRLFPSGRIRAIEAPDWRIEQAGPGWQLSPPREGLSADQLNGFVQGWELVRAMSLAPLAAGTAPAGVVYRVWLVDQAQPLEFVRPESAQGLSLVSVERGLRYQLTDYDRRRLLDPPQAVPAVEVAPGDGAKDQDADG